MLVAVGMPDVFVYDGSGGELGDFGLLGLGTDAIAFSTRDLGLVFAFTSPPLSRVSSLLARKLAVLAKVLMSSTACSRLPLPEDFSITSIRRRNWHCQTNLTVLRSILIFGK